MDEQNGIIESNRKPLRKPPWVTSPMTFVNTREFSREALHFMKHKCYTFAPEGTRDYHDYWTEQYKRCREGYSIGGVYITGKHYDYLNFTKIKALDPNEKHGKKKLNFPRFLDIDYYFYHEVEEAIRQGKGLCVAKARRKGVSFKASHLAKVEYIFEKDSRSIVGAYLDKYANTTMKMAREMVNFVNETEFGKSYLVKEQDYIKSGFTIKNEGSNIEIEKGYKSEILTLTFNRNTSASIGDSPTLFLFEEAGKWPGLLKSYNFTYPAFKDGKKSNAFWIIFGTGGDMESGATEDFKKLFYQPDLYDLLSYENIYEESSVGEAGLFIDDAWYMPPHVDEEGNSNREAAIAENLAELEKIKASAQNMSAIEAHMTQHPLTPSQAFFISSGSYFPDHLIRAQIQRIESDNRLKTIGKKGLLSGIGTEVTFTESDNVFECPFPFKREMAQGCVVIYEKPFMINGEVPRGLYIACLDPYAQNSAQTNSVGSFFIYKKYHKDDPGSYNMIVAEYTGRPDDISDYYDNVILLLRYYNGICNFENNIQGVTQHFDKRRMLKYLSSQPTSAIKSIVPGSKVERGYGTHMTDALKIAGITWLREWIKTEKYPGYYNINDVYSLNLLQELLMFDNKDNFDRVSSMILLMFLMQEEKFRFDKEAVEVQKTSHLDYFANLIGWQSHEQNLRRTPWHSSHTKS